MIDTNAATTWFRLEDRRSFRHAIAYVTRLRELGGVDAPVILRDLSTVGFSGESHIRLTAPTLVALNLPPHGEVRARVRWVRDRVIGGEFLHRLDQDVIERVLEQAPGSVIDIGRASAEPE